MEEDPARAEAVPGLGNEKVTPSWGVTNARIELLSPSDEERHSISNHITS